MRRGDYGSEPDFDEEIIEEYRRASAEQFTRPPATPLRQINREEQFRWPEIDRRRDTVSLERDELTKMVARRPAVPQEVDPLQDVEDTVTGQQTQWVLDVLGGSLFLIPGNDVIIGRRPATLPGGGAVTIEDPGRTLSKTHARLTFESGFWIIEDLGSTNGTAILPGDDIDISMEKTLEPGRPARVVDRFRLGTLHVRLRQLVS